MKIKFETNIDYPLGTPYGIVTVNGYEVFRSRISANPALLGYEDTARGEVTKHFAAALKQLLAPEGGQ